MISKRGSRRAAPSGPLYLNSVGSKWKFLAINAIMAKKENLMDRIDTIRANSVTDKEFEQTWGESLDVHVEKMMGRWDELLAQAKKSIESKNQKA